jgi:hypothetical protein
MGNSIPAGINRHTWTLPTLREISSFWISWDQMRAYIRPWWHAYSARRALMGLALLNLITSCGVMIAVTILQSLKEPV